MTRAAYLRFASEPMVKDLNTLNIDPQEADDTVDEIVTNFETKPSILGTAALINSHDTVIKTNEIQFM
jgi:hypothetical protein